MRRKRQKRGWIKANFTVEAAIIVPVILFTIAGGIELGYGMFQDAKIAVEIDQQLKDLDPADIVRRLTVMQELGNSM